MPISGNFTLFTSGAGSGTSSSDYTKAAFQDISIEATNNTSLTSTALTNPLGQFFGDDDAPKYSVKTLWVKDLILLEDRTKWISGKATYEVIFTENFPGVYAYVYGNPRLRNTLQGVSVDLRSVDDGFGITGVLRRAGWIVNTTPNTMTADILIDGVDTTNDIAGGSSVSTSNIQGLNAYNLQICSTTNSTYGLHDFQVTGNNDYSLNIAGIAVYFENSSNNIDLFPGTTYVDKDIKTSSGITTMALPTITGSTGAKTLIYKNSSGVYSSNTSELPNIASVAIGSSGTNLLGVVTGFGASFPIGTGFVTVSSGSSFYLGTVSNQSTDTLTVGPTLPFGVSGSIYKAWRSGITLAINASMYQLANSFDAGYGNVAADLNGFGISPTGDFYYSCPYSCYRVWGDQLAWLFQDGNNGVAFNGATVGFLQIDGRYSALEFELAVTPGVTGILHFTAGLNGIAGVVSTNEFVSSNKKITLFTDAGTTWNTFVFNVGASFGNITIKKINMYERANQGVTLGLLAQFDTLTNRAPRAAANATMTDLGLYQRVYADQLYLTTDWTRGTTTTAAGGAYYAGTTGILSFQYYGTDFALIGSAGTSCNITIDGASFANTFNVMKSVATLNFHKVVLTGNTGTTRIEAIDFIRPKGELENLQAYLPRKELDDAPVIFEQSDTPRNPKAGDIWAQYPYTNSVWVYLFNRWNQFQINQSTDDPNVQSFYVAHGSTTRSSATATTTSRSFNLTSWATTASSGLTATLLNGAGNAAYNGSLYLVGGLSSGGGSVTDQKAKFNKVAWTTISIAPLANLWTPGLASFAGFLMTVKGTNSSAGAVGAQSGCYAWNNAAWSTKATWLDVTWLVGSFISNNLLYSVTGQFTDTAEQNIANSRNTADAVSASTVMPTTGSPNCGSQQSGLIGTVPRYNNGSVTAIGYAWNSAAWSSAITFSYAAEVSVLPATTVYFQSRNISLNHGGGNGSSSLSTSETYNGVSASSSVSSGQTIVAATGGVF